MSIAFTISSAAVPTNLQCVISDERWQQLVALLSATSNSEITILNIGSTEPSPENRIYPWLRTNSDGSPDRLYHYWNGSWVSKHPLPPAFGAMLYTGTEASIKTFDGGADVPVTDITGPFWEVVTALGAKFPVGPGAFSSGATVAIGGTGGEEKHLLVASEIPAHTHEASGTFVKLGTAGPNLQAVQYGPNNTLSGQPFQSFGGDAAHNNLPPYVGTWFIRRTTRLYYTV